MSSSTSGTDPFRRTWEAAAPGWAKWEPTLSAGLSGATETLIDMAGIAPGMRVLDVACGAGSQTMAAAKRVGPDGRIVASDISATMLDHMRRNAAAAGLSNIETLECKADALPESQGPFDAAMSRLGLMLFAAPHKALAAVGRVLQPGARMAALVFTTPDNNPYMARPMAILLRHAGKSPPAPGQPGIFALGGNGVLERLFADSGFENVRAEHVRARLALPKVGDALEMMREGFGAYRAVVADLSEVERSKAWDEVHECLQAFDTGTCFETVLEFVIGAGVRPE